MEKELKQNKQETLEEAAKNYIENTMKFSFNFLETKTQANRMLKCVEFGAKWQQEQDEKLYNEEDLREAFRQGEQNINYSEIYGLDSKLTEQEWFEKFKKK